MSRIGKEPVKIPIGVEVTLGAENQVSVKGEKGSITRKLHLNMKIEKADSEIIVSRPDDTRQNKALHGLTRSLIFNMVNGVSNGYRKDLEIIGVGYRAEKKGRGLLLNLGYSHHIFFIPPEGIDIEVPSNTAIGIMGVDKELVGLIAAKIRSFRPPEPYKGKGIRYKNEFVARKVGKYAK
ncbi:50S ribosomal protein L6 [bacterium]|nr:50S ribosomal protein L6 [bacterium]